MKTKSRAKAKAPRKSSAKKSPELVLASQSTARRRLLKRLAPALGLEFKVMPAHIDEKAVERMIKDPRALVLELSKRKAWAVQEKRPGRVVIGSDQVLVCQGRIFGKPLTKEKACAQLRASSGKTLSLLTGVCVIDSAGREDSFVQETRLQFRKLSSQEITDYVEFDKPLDCAGSFKFESRGISLFEGVATDDPTAIEGLPLMRLSQALRRAIQRYHAENA